MDMYIWINHVLHSMSIYLMSAINPLKGVIDQIYRIFVKLFWGHIDGVKEKHWVA